MRCRVRSLRTDDRSRPVCRRRRSRPRRPDVKAENRLRQLGSPRADQSRDADDLAGADVQDRCRGCPPNRAQTREFKYDVAAFDRSLWEDRRELAADHQPNRAARCSTSAISCVPIVSSVSQNRHAIGDRRQFFQPVRNVDHPDALFAKLANDAKKIPLCPLPKATPSAHRESGSSRLRRAPARSRPTAAAACESSAGSPVRDLSVHPCVRAVHGARGASLAN